MKTLSKKAGLSDGYLSGIMKTGRTPSIENLTAIAEAAGTTPGWLLMGDDDLRIKIPVLGTVTSAETWVPAPGAAKNVVEFDLGSGYDVVAIEVRGDAMAPVYRDQDFLICQRRIGKFADNLIGTDCAVRTVHGRNYVKILKKGSRLNMFTLRSYNAAVQDIENVALEWVAPIVWIKRGGR